MKYLDSQIYARTQLWQIQPKQSTLLSVEGTNIDRNGDLKGYFLL